GWGLPSPACQSVAACFIRIAKPILPCMASKSRDRLYGSSVRIAAQRAAEARKKADKLACEAWIKRMLASRGLRSHLPHSVTRSTQVTGISKSAASDVTHT